MTHLLMGTIVVYRSEGAGVLVHRDGRRRCSSSTTRVEDTQAVVPREGDQQCMLAVKGKSQEASVLLHWHKRSWSAIW